MIAAHALALILVGAGGPAPPLAITTDTRAYCQTLAARVERRPRSTAEIRRLAALGLSMCDTGEVAGGVLRLREALLLTEQPGP